MTHDAIYQKLVSLAGQRFGRDLSSMSPEDDFFEKLQIDSYQAMELLTELEDAFDVEIPDYEVQEVRTFGGLVEIIGRRL